ncbi:hypothetical protein ADIMK_0281 [Marinobacterium lacunae]|uniref:Uncharacterized protein n=1 Tax=Marinobacterium lacunae TaxID=1232683 RepID=A0A081G3G9_9GAMM|nr:hypothetical protein [Marinobacterium lacunae]KEA65324.1 hypothetical protein ADIMK_0281 [Marinobacterium lacunae]
MTVETLSPLEQENIEYQHTGGISQNNAQHAFVPAFQDACDQRVELSRFRDGRVASFHTLDGLPEEWIVKRDRAGRVVEIRSSIVSGFVRHGRFFSRQEAANYIDEIA